MSDDPDAGGPALEELLGFIRSTRGFDFTGYKRPGLTRRFRRRVEALGLAGFDDYRDFLEVHPEEYPRLFDSVLINVTRFFREPETWEVLARTIVPGILTDLGDDEPVRIWSAGCSTGEEAYSLAMMLCDALGEPAFRERVKIYATDIDDDALAQARRGQYSQRQVEGLAPDLLERYFEDVGQRYQFRPELRRMVIFGHHDVTEDAPISRLSLLVSRNTLMYLTSETQRRVVARFHYALRDGHGHLFLGKAETLGAQSDLFTQVDTRHRVFARAPGNARLMPIVGDGVYEGVRASAPPGFVRQLAQQEAPVAQLAVDADGRLAFANARARAAFGLQVGDEGRPFRDLELSFRPLELRSRIEEVTASRGPVCVEEVEHTLSTGQSRYYDVLLGPLMDDGRLEGVSIAFVDADERVRLRREAERADQALETANEELQSTNEELETANEELQSTNEELETTNEELQSTNEELETLNEELRSSNEELGTMNEELQSRTAELGRLNTFMESIMGSVTMAVVVLDQDFAIEAWNPHAEELWGLRHEEAVGRSLLALDMGLPVAELAAPIRALLADDSEGAELTLDAVNRRGRPMRVRVTLTPLVRNDHGHDGVVVIMEELGESEG